MGEQADHSGPRAELDRELAELRDGVLRLGDRVDDAIDRAMDALRKRDAPGAQSVIDGDGELNAIRFDIEENCIRLIATQQPAAGDLRAIVAAMNMVNDLERMGDHAAGIGKAVVRMQEDPYLDIPVALELIAEQARKMLRVALSAYKEVDLDKAHQVAEMDDIIDVHYRKLFRDLLGTMSSEPEKSGAAVRMQFASHNLERIADRATNLAERVIFQSSGEMLELNPEPNESGFN
jgi:phosphate transport system protein